MEEDKGDDTVIETYLQDTVYKTMIENGVKQYTADVILPNLFHRLRTENYDTSLIKVIPPEISHAIRIFYEAFVDNIGYWNSKTNLPLLYCLRNYHMMLDGMQNYNIRKFSGAYNILRLDNRGRIVYLLSDFTHSYKNRCTDTEKTIADFIRETINNTDKFVDIFIEADIFDNIARKTDSFLCSVRDQFADCVPTRNPGISPFKRIEYGCPPNARIHFSDPRMSVHDNPILSLDVIEIKSDLSYYERLMFSLPVDFNSRDNLQEIMVACKHMLTWFPVVVKEMNKVEEKLREIIVYETIYFFFKEIITLGNIQELVDIIRRKDYSNFNEETRFALVAGFLIEISPFIMDVYTLCRMFKKYNVKNTYYPEQCRYIIVYAGDYHISCYNYVLTKLGFRFRGYDKGRNASCLELRNIKLPLFQD